MRRQVLVAGGILAVFAAVMVGTAVLSGGGAPPTAPLPTVASRAPVPPMAASPVPTAAPSPIVTTRVAPPAAVAPGKPSPSPSPAVAWQTEPGTPEREVEAAYLRYWQVRSEALRTTDPSWLPEVMAEGELTRTIQQVEQLRREGHAARVEVEHSYLLVDVTPESAAIQDELSNRSVLIDPATGAALQDPEASEELTLVYQLRKVGGLWKVVDSVQVVER